MDPTGYVIDVQHFSVNDGDGIRTTVFLAGCNMRCQWCSNPESFTTFDKILHNQSSCVACGRCVAVCPYGVGMNLSDPAERKKCRSCSRCVPVCPSGARRSAIRRVSVSELAAEIDKYSLFYRYSDGGVTFSGGEATRQLAFLDHLSEVLYDNGIDLCLESNGDFDYDALQPVLERLSLCFIDLKHLDEAAHRRYTGVTNQRTLENIAKIGQTDLPLVIRIPLIESVNADEDLIRRIAQFVKQHVKHPRIELLPYHAYGEIKYAALGLKQPDSRFQTPSAEMMEHFQAILVSQGITVDHFR